MGTDLIVPGCTEVALMLPGSGLPTLDTVDALINATIRSYCELTGKTPTAQRLSTSRKND